MIHFSEEPSMPPELTDRLVYLRGFDLNFDDEVPISTVAKQ